MQANLEKFAAAHAGKMSHRRCSHLHAPLSLSLPPPGLFCVDNHE